MTVCVAALCENGRKVVVATDRRLSMGGIASDALAGKMFWFSDWLFLYAGVPSHVELINEELRTFQQPLDRANVYEAVLAAYRKAKAKYCAHAVLAHYDFTMEEFKAEGLKQLGAKVFSGLAQRLDDKQMEFNEWLLVIGYGSSENSGHIFQIGPENLDSFALSGSTAIGSGAEVAQSTLMSLGQTRSSSLGDTLYAVAAAKFSAEMSQVGDDRDLVSESTAMYVTWKREDRDEAGKPPGEYIQDYDIKKLRAVWESHGKPRIPLQSAPALWPIVYRLRERNAEPPTRSDIALRFRAEEQVQRFVDEAEASVERRIAEQEQDTHEG